MVHSCFNHISLVNIRIALVDARRCSFPTLLEDLQKHSPRREVHRHRDLGSQHNPDILIVLAPVYLFISRLYPHLLMLNKSHVLLRHMAMDQYLLIPFLGGWTSIYQLFWCSPGVQGFDTLPYGTIHAPWWKDQGFMVIPPSWMAFHDYWVAEGSSWPCGAFRTWQHGLPPDFTKPFGVMKGLILDNSIYIYTVIYIYILYYI